MLEPLHFIGEMGDWGGKGGVIEIIILMSTIMMRLYVWRIFKKSGFITKGKTVEDKKNIPISCQLVILWL